MILKNLLNEKAASRKMIESPLTNSSSSSVSDQYLQENTIWKYLYFCTRVVPTTYYSII